MYSRMTWCDLVCILASGWCSTQGPSCSWFNRVQTHMGTHAQLISRGLCTAWDIEDLVALGKKTRVSFLNVS